MADEPHPATRVQWRVAVWALRVGYVALAVAVVGLLADLTGHTPWVLAAGEIVWLVAAVTTATAFLLAWKLQGRRPGIRRLLSSLVHDSATLHLTRT